MPSPPRNIWISLEKWKSKVLRAIEVAGHKDPRAKGNRGLNIRESSFILATLGELHYV